MHSHLTTKPRDSRKLSTLLLLTSDRLEHESLRADNAERRAADYLARLRSALDAKERADHDIARISEELRLYKIQLDAAQREIFRAQEIVQQVENARLDADADAAKARSLARGLQEQWAVMTAREEGRRQGYKEGLRRGRRVGFEEGRADGYADGQDDVRRQEYDDDNDDEPPSKSPPRVLPTETPRPPSRHSSRSHRDRDRVDHDPNHVPDVAPFAPILPVPTIVTPDPSLRQSVPSAVPFLNNNSPEPPRTRSLRSHPSIRSRPPSPASTTDGWIPNADKNSFIAMPAPHELSNPAIAATAAAAAATTAIPESSSSPPSPSLSSQHQQQQRDRVRSRDYAYPPTSQPPQPQPPSRPRSSSAASRVSTRFSDFDLVSPPRRQRERDRDRDRDREPSQRSERDVGGGGGGGDGDVARDRDSRKDRERDGESSRGRNSTRSLDPHERSQPERIAQEWRSANADVVTPPRNDYVQSSADVPPHSNSSWGRQRGTVEVPEPVVVAKRIAALENPVLVARADRPRTPILESLFGKKKNKNKNKKTKESAAATINTKPPLSRDSSNATVVIRVDPPSSSASNASDNTARRTAHLLSPDSAHQIRPLNDENINDTTTNNNNNNAHQQRNMPPVNIYSAVLPPPPILSPVQAHVPITLLPPPSSPLSPHHHSKQLTTAPAPALAPALAPPPLNKSPRYEVAPIPPGVTYPDPPSRQQRRDSPDRSRSRVRRRRRPHHHHHHEENLGTSPAPLDRPISLFSDPD